MDLIGLTSDQELQNIVLTNYSYCNDNVCNSESQSKIDNQNLSYVDDSSYALETNKLYKIWFNSDPDHFLSKKNKLRLAELRINNQDAKLSLVYSEELMSLAIKKEVNEFLDIYQINLVDFDVILKEALNNPNFPKTELTLLTLAKEELNNLGESNNGGGNAAAATDILRFCPSVAQLGIYSDFDVHLDFKNITASLDISSPIIIPHNNNDFVAFAKGKDGQLIHQNALKEIYKIQNAILNNYKAYDSRDLEFFQQKDFMNEILFNKAQQKGKSFSIVEYRSQVKKLDIYDRIEFIKFYGANDYVDPTKYNQNYAAINSVKKLDEINAKNLFCAIQTDVNYILASPHINLMTEGLNSIFESIRNNINDYEIEHEGLKSQILNFESMDLQSMKRTLSYLGIPKMAGIPINNISDKSDDAKSNYCHLAVTIDLLEWKTMLYSASVMNISGPKVLDKLYSQERNFFSPENNKLNGIIRADGQDGSWYLGA